MDGIVSRVTTNALLNGEGPTKTGVLLLRSDGGRTIPKKPRLLLSAGGKPTQIKFANICALGGTAKKANSGKRRIAKNAIAKLVNGVRNIQYNCEQ